MHVCLCLQASQLIVNYDEHEVNNTYKFGVIYQRFGQVPHHLLCVHSVFPSSFFIPTSGLISNRST